MIISQRLFRCQVNDNSLVYYSDVKMGAIASQITSLTIVYWTVYSGADQWKHQSSSSLAFVRGIHRGPVNYPHKRPVTRKMFPFHDVIMYECWSYSTKTFLVLLLANPNFRMQYYDYSRHDNYPLSIALTHFGVGFRSTAW